MKFQKVTSSKYVGTNNFSLLQLRDGSFSIVKDNTVTRWGTNFQTVRSAEIFLNKHDYIHASTDCIPMNDEDIDLIYDMYCSKGDPSFGRRWYITNSFWIQGGYGKVPSQDLQFLQFRCSDGTCYKDGDALVDKLDAILNSISPFSYVDKQDECAIFAARKLANSKNKGGLRPQDLMRVKSSNVWAIGAQVHDEDRRTGDVYIQFKGKEGGPGDVYKYYDVPMTLYKKFITAPSKGAFTWKYLRNNFLYSKLTGDKKGKLRNAVN